MLIRCIYESKIAALKKILGSLIFNSMHFVKLPSLIDFIGLYIYINKNDNIHENEVQNIGFGISIEFLIQRKNFYSNRSRNNEIGLLWSGQYFGKVQYRILNLNQNSKSKKKKLIQIGLETTKLD